MLFSPPTIHPERLSLATELSTLFTSWQLDAAVDDAARDACCTIATFAAAPADVWNEHCSSGECAAIEFVIEFFVPPADLDIFHRALEARLLRASRRYLRQRSLGVFAPCVIRSVPASAFHQYRLTLKRSDPGHPHDRWSPSRSFVEGVLHQSRIGWRDGVV